MTRIAVERSKLCLTCGASTSFLLSLLTDLTATRERKIKRVLRKIKPKIYWQEYKILY